MTTLASLLSGASLEVVVPSSSDHASPPPSNLVHNSAVGPQAVDEWARELLKAAPRPSLYRDEVVNVYLALSIADPENNLAQQDLASALARARQEGHLISQLELQLDGASSTAARPQRTGSLAFPAFRVDTASYTIAPGGSTADTSASEGALKSEQWWLARVEARYVLLWHFAGRPRGMSSSPSLELAPSNRPPCDFADDQSPACRYAWCARNKGRLWRLRQTLARLSAQRDCVQRARRRVHGRGGIRRLLDQYPCVQHDRSTSQ